MASTLVEESDINAAQNHVEALLDYYIPKYYAPDYHASMTTTDPIDPNATNDHDI